MCHLSPLAHLDHCTRLSSSKKIIFILESKLGCLMVAWANAVFTVMPAILKQGSANCSPQAKSGPLAGFINKVLLEQS